MDKQISREINLLHDVIVRMRGCFPVFGYPIHRNENYWPFFIIGSGRSGSTLLRRILFAHSKLNIPPETYRLGPIVKLFRQNRMMSWKNLVHLCLSEFEYSSEFDTFGTSLRPLAIQLLETPFQKRSLAYILNAFYLYYATSPQKEKHVIRWGDKSPVNTLWLENIRCVFPDAQYIHIVRDGYDVINSYMNSGLSNEVLEAAFRWVVSTRAAMSFEKRNPRACIQIRYEDLVNDSEKTTIKVCNFLQIEFEEKMLMSHHQAALMGDVPLQNHHSNIFKPIFKDSIGKGRRSLSEEDHKKIGSIILSQLKQLGYQK